MFTHRNELFKRLAALWLLALSAVLCFSAYLNLFEAPRGTLEVISTINFALLAWLLMTFLPKGIWSISFIFFISLGIFHMGLVVANSFDGITDEDIHYQISWWFHNKQTDNAIHVVNIALLGLSTALLLFYRNSEAMAEQDMSEENRKRLFHVGGISLLFFILLFFGLIYGTGAAASYGKYLLIKSASPLLSTIFAYTYFFLGLTLVLVCVCYRPGLPKYYFIAFGVWAAIAFKLGLRGEVMFPTAIAAAMLGRRSAPVKTTTLAIAVVLFLVLTGIVKNARVSGDYSQGLSVNPLNAVAEMGSTLRAVQEVIKWREGGFELLHGGSYWAPIERQLALFLPNVNRLPVHQDNRLLNVVVQEKAGPIGFSAIAEAYINFGETGVFCIFFLFGLILTKLDSTKSSIKTDFIIGAGLVPVMITVRNSFTHVPVQIILAFVIAYFLMFIAYRKPSRKKSG